MPSISRADRFERIEAGGALVVHRRDLSGLSRLRQRPHQRKSSTAAAQPRGMLPRHAKQFKLTHMIHSAAKVQAAGGVRSLAFDATHATAIVQWRDARAADDRVRDLWRSER